MNDESKICGVLMEHKNISFVIDNFQCVFINSNMFEGKVETITASRGFVLGRTTATERKYIYIYIGNDIKISSQSIFNTSLYLISDRDDLTSFETILFQGGILNKLFYRSALTLDGSGSSVSIKKGSDIKCYSLTNDKIKGTLSISSAISEGVSVEKGAYISNDGARLELKFEEIKDLKSFSELFGYILELCRFMTFRKNVKFEEIAIYETSEQYPENNKKLADCFVRYDNMPDTEKKICHCITFNEMGESVDRLLDSIVNNQPKKPQFNLGFIPENDKDVYYITSVKIREVCSALESEMELAKIKVKQEEEFEKLVKTLKSEVSVHKQGENPLRDAKVYDYISGTLDHLSGALADRIEKCFSEHESELTERLNPNQIAQIVSYRNVITHGSYMPLDIELAKTAYVLMKLVYCCVLKRIGLNENMIHHMMMKNILS